MASRIRLSRDTVGNFCNIFLDKHLGSGNAGMYGAIPLQELDLPVSVMAIQMPRKGLKARIPA